MTKLHQLLEVGQLVWMDYIRRDMIHDGTLDNWIEQGLRGMTSNPSIFDEAISGSDAYDEQLKELFAAGDLPAQEIYEALAIKDIQDAADKFRPVYDARTGHHGFISLEANPHLAHDTEGTIKEVRRLHAKVNRPNVMFKVPATEEGIPAIETLISEGININITLMFSMKHYEAVANAFLKGLHTFSVAGGDVASVHSVASFFISRVDVKLDDKLAEKGHEELKGKIGIANAKMVYQRFREIFKTKEWEYLSDQGARIQYPLWASTSVKDPSYPKTMYADNLIGEYTVNTLPPDTIEAFLDEGSTEPSIQKGLDEARQQLDKLEELGFDLIRVGDELQEEGVDKFVRPFDNLLETIEAQRDKLPTS